MWVEKYGREKGLSDLNQSERLKNSICNFFASDDAIELVILFGSRAQNRSRPDSDVDLAVLATAPLSVDDLVERKLNLASVIGYEVDLIDISQCHGAILEEIMCKGEILIRRNLKAFENLLKRMWYEKEDDQRFSEKTIKERMKLWHR